MFDLGLIPLKSRESMSGVKRKMAALTLFWLCKFLKWNSTQCICLWPYAPSKKWMEQQMLKCSAVIPKEIFCTVNLILGY